MMYLLSLIGVVFVCYVVVDAEPRGRSPHRWGILVAFTGGIGFVAYLVARRSTPPTGSPLGPRRTAQLVLGGLVISAVAAIVASWTVTTVVQLATVEGHAMEPTLADGSAAIVNRLAYRWTPPRRGEVVMLYYPVNPDKLFVKRVIAEEGDLVRIVDGRVFVNDKLREDNEVAHDARAHDDWGPQIIPEGYFFVLGDRRNNSSDSRHWGMVPKKYIVGRVAFRLTGPGAFTFVR
jgi:signal peptidase I